MKLHQIKIGDKKNPPLIFLHGLFGQGDDFLEIVNKFSDKYFCILVDLPGHGLSRAFKENSFEDLCNFIMDSLGPFTQKPSIVGYSLGGRISLYLATHFPDKFKNAIIISANPGLETGREKRLNEDLRLLNNISNATVFFNTWFSNPIFGKLKTHKNFQNLLEKRKISNFENIKKCLGSFSVGTQPSLWSKLQNNILPMLYICGQDDKKYLDIGKTLEAFPKIKLEIIPNAAHYLHFEKPSIFLGHIEEYLK